MIPLCKEKLLMKVGISITVHNGQNNPTGHHDLEECLESLFMVSNFEFEVIVIDNSSDTKWDHPFLEKDNLEYVYIEDQHLTGGLTGAWNFGIHKLYLKNCDVILNSGEDIVFNSTINKFVRDIYDAPYKEVGLFGPTANRSGLSTPHQAREISSTTGFFEGDKIIETTHSQSTHGGCGYALAGFFLGFSKEFFEKFNIDNSIFGSQPECAWGGQEVELFEKNTPKGMRSFILESGYITHKKHRSWMKGPTWKKS
jgi:glycosyltransferase involved in cell wall biosynthesis